MGTPPYALRFPRQPAVWRPRLRSARGYEAPAATKRPRLRSDRGYAAPLVVDGQMSEHGSQTAGRPIGLGYLARSTIPESCCMNLCCMDVEAGDNTPRQFALWVVEKLRAAGFQSLWAGGCVRDELLGLEPSDYDVATDATPEQVRACFGKRHTLAIGAAFGVIVVLGRGNAGQVEVATFRRDVGYSDGRRPDAVEFCTAREDALRRDFTMNGLFFDPVSQQVLDFVGGREDLAAGIVRAIGDPVARFGEDKLRMLRAARFASTFGFHIDPLTAEAVRREARSLLVVSAERIAAEMRKMLVPATRADGVALLRELHLLEVILPEASRLFEPRTDEEPGDSLWPTTLTILRTLRPPTFRLALAALLWGIHGGDPQPPTRVRDIGARLKLSNYDAEGLAWLLTQEPLLRRARTVPWPTLQRVLIAPAIDEALTLTEATASVVDGHTYDIEYCRARCSIRRCSSMEMICGGQASPPGRSSARC